VMLVTKDVAVMSGRAAVRTARGSAGEHKELVQCGQRCARSRARIGLILVSGAAVAGCAAVVGGNDHVTLLQQLAKDVELVGSDVPMNVAVSEHHQRQLLARHFCMHS
jgi:hypothetical protein